MGAVFQALEGLRRQACSMMFRENAAAGDVLWSDGDTDAETFHILLRGGPIREVKEGETVRTLGATVANQIFVQRSPQLSTRNP